jgi:hypothetical protein
VLGLGRQSAEPVAEHLRRTGEKAVPVRVTMPFMEITSNPVPTKRNPLGAKGAGEAGTVGALPAIVNAVVDALAPNRQNDARLLALARSRCREGPLRAALCTGRGATFARTTAILGAAAGVAICG